MSDKWPYDADFQALIEDQELEKRAEWALREAWCREDEKHDWVRVSFDYCRTCGITSNEHDDHEDAR